MIPTGCPSFEIAPPRTDGGATVRATDFGLSGNSWHVERDAPQIKVSIKLSPEYSRMESVPITNAAFAAEVAANIAAWEPFPFAGKIRVSGSSGNVLPVELMEKKT